MPRTVNTKPCGPISSISSLRPKSPAASGIPREASVFSPTSSVKHPKRAFFLSPQKGPQASPKTDPVRDQVVALRKQNLSIYDISRVLEERGQKVSAVAVSLMLKEEGFARLPRRKDEERLPGPRPEVAAVADVEPAGSFRPAIPDPVRGALSCLSRTWPRSPWSGCSKRRGSRGHR